jgi:response regulator RpfG family c-di-GMP phosphodiesterase
MELFADHREQANTDPESKVQKVGATPWKVLLVDDDVQMHQITKLALNGFTFQERKLELISAYTGLEAQELLKQHNDIAVALVDVVMETEHAGLELVKFIRTELKNRMTRLVLRTGQAGQAPEDIVIQEYEIDDYKEKTELTTQKLRTLLYSMLRSYRDLCVIEEQKEGLSKVIEASANVQNTNTLKTYASSVLRQLTSLLSLEASAFYCIVQPDPSGEDSRALTLAATGEYVNFYPVCSFDLLPELVAKRCMQALEQRETIQFPDAYVFYSSDDRHVTSILYLNLNEELSDLDRQLLKIYMQNIALTFENLNLLVDLQDTSKELVYNLANAVEARSKETGAHVQRVSMISEKLANLYGLDEEETLMIKHASPLHDIGKVAIPDSILHKPGKLDAGEWDMMKKHVDFGVEILSKSKRRLIVVAREIAGYHHEKWDGSGYPNGLSGEDIPITGRITAIADVFDALGSKRSYKEAWTSEKIREEIVAQSGKHFEPRLVDLMLQHWEEFIEIRDQYPD